MAPYDNSESDPWADVEDIDGQGLYRLLGVEVQAPPGAIKAAYRRLARTAHPDKGGDSQTFAKIQNAYETLIDPEKRQTYDLWAKEIKYRYIPGVAIRAEGGEGVLLDEFETMGLHVDAYKQLVICCEVCRRPATNVCFICDMNYCKFCSRKQHWKGKYPLHWPMQNSDDMRKRIAKDEFEKKRIEDARKYLLEDPNFRNEKELAEIAAFKSAANIALDKGSMEVTYYLELAKYYCWAQTEDQVFVAVHIPTGFADKELEIHVTQYSLRIQPQNSPPVINRTFDYPIAERSPIETFLNDQKTFFTAVITKARKGERWMHLFTGDSDGVRCLEPIYRKTETNDEVVLEFDLPFWIDSDDVRVEFRKDGIRVNVRNTLLVERTFWTEPDAGKKRAIIDIEECMWSLDEETDPDGGKIKVLMVNLVKPELPPEDKEWRRGERKDNRNKDRPGGLEKGYRFFADDEDHFRLEDKIMALAFLETRETYVPAVPWDRSRQAAYVSDLRQLPTTAKEFLNVLLDSHAEKDKPKEAGGA